MESPLLNLHAKNQITAYMKDNHMMAYERSIFQDMISAIEAGNQTQIDWFRSFGDSFRTITSKNDRRFFYLNYYPVGIESG